MSKDPVNHFYPVLVKKVALLQSTYARQKIWASLESREWCIKILELFHFQLICLKTQPCTFLCTLQSVCYIIIMSTQDQLEFRLVQAPGLNASCSQTPAWASIEAWFHRLKVNPNLIKSIFHSAHIRLIQKPVNNVTNELCVMKLNFLIDDKNQICDPRH